MVRAPKHHLLPTDGKLVYWYICKKKIFEQQPLLRVYCSCKSFELQNSTIRIVVIIFPAELVEQQRFPKISLSGVGRRKEAVHSLAIVSQLRHQQHLQGLVKFLLQSLQLWTQSWVWYAMTSFFLSATSANLNEMAWHYLSGRRVETYTRVCHTMPIQLFA